MSPEDIVLSFTNIYIEWIKSLESYICAENL